MSHLKNGKIEPRGVQVAAGQQHQHQSHRQRYGDLRAHFVAGQQAVVGVTRDLQVVVREPDRAERGRRQDRDPDVHVGQVRPEQRGQQGGRQDEQTAHGRRTRLRAVRRRPLVPNHLTDLELAKRANQPGPEQQADGQGRQARGGGAKRDVTGHVQHRDTWCGAGRAGGTASGPLRLHAVRHDVGPGAAGPLDQHHVAGPEQRRDGGPGLLARLRTG